MSLGHGNRFEGSIPFLNVENMTELLLHGNRLTGEFPMLFLLLPFPETRSPLEKLTFYDNDVHGDANELCQLKNDPSAGSLETFAVDLNKIACDCCTGPP